MTNPAPGSKLPRRFHGHAIVGPDEAMMLFSRLDSSSQANYFREAQHYGVTRVMLGDTSWELIRHPNHTFEIRRAAHDASL